MATVKSQIDASRVVIQKKGIPLRNPRNNGGSPMGVSGASYVTDKKNKEHNMITFNAVTVDAQKRTDQYHGSSRRSQ